MTTKLCPNCKTIKPISEFHKNKGTNDGHTHVCKPCGCEVAAKWKQAHPQRVKDYEVQNKDKNKARYQEHKRQKAALNLPAIRILKSAVNSARYRSKKNNLPFDLIYEDIPNPTHCPVLGIVLNYNPAQGTNKDNWASLDRIIPSLGYVMSNILVVSLKANRIKNDATIEELNAVCNFYNKYSQCSPSLKPTYPGLHAST